MPASSAFDSGRARLASVAGLRSVPTKVIERIVKEIQKNPEILSENTPIKKKNDIAYKEVIKNTTALTLLPGDALPAGTYDWEYLDAQSVLQVSCKESPAWTAELRSLWQSAGPIWKLVFYLDEVEPGNALAPDHPKKLCIMWVSFLEFQHKLCEDAFWLPLALIRSKVAQQVLFPLGPHHPISSSDPIYKSLFAMIRIYSKILDNFIKH